MPKTVLPQPSAQHPRFFTLYPPDPKKCIFLDHQPRGARGQSTSGRSLGLANHATEEEYKDKRSVPKYATLSAALSAQEKVRVWGTSVLGTEHTQGLE